MKSGQLGGNRDTFMLIFSADTCDFLVTDMLLEQRCSRYVPTGTDLVMNFNLAKILNKKRYT